MRTILDKLCFFITNSFSSQRCDENKVAPVNKPSVCGRTSSGVVRSNRSSDMALRKASVTLDKAASSLDDSDLAVLAKHPYLLSLPDEALLAILERLPVSSLASVCRVNARINTICRDVHLQSKVGRTAERIEEAQQTFVLWTALVANNLLPYDETMTFSWNIEEPKQKWYPTKQDGGWIAEFEYTDRVVSAATLSQLAGLVMKEGDITSAALNHVTKKVKRNEWITESITEGFAKLQQRSGYEAIFFSASKFRKWYTSSSANRLQMYEEMEVLSNVAK